VSAGRIALALLAIVAWSASIYAVHGQAAAMCPAGALPALGAIELAQLDDQARTLCKRRPAGTVITLPDGVLTCAAARST
jgi:hypothetical protein